MTGVDVIFPALNEAEALPWVLSRLPDGHRAIVVDNGSSDGTSQVAEEHGALVVHESRRGFGSACWAGLQAASAEAVCFSDADASLDPQDLPLVSEPVMDDEVDLALGRRTPTGRDSWPLLARVANHALAWEVSRRSAHRLRDLGPMRAARRTALLDLGLVDRRFGWPLEMVLRASAAGWRITEVDVPYHPRTGRSKVTGTLKGTIRTIRDMTHALRTIPTQT